MNDYCLIAEATIGSAVFSFAVHISSDCNDPDFVWNYIQHQLSIHYGFKEIRSSVWCEFETFWYYPCRIDLD